MTPSHAPMDGLKVIDFSSLVAGPWATRLMADCGAEVIKIEPVGEGDVIRYAPPVVDGESRVFAQFNRGKKSVALDLKAPADIEIARRLIDQADVVVENFRPGVMDRLGLGYVASRARNPRLVYCAVSGFGQEGPLAGEAAYAPVVHAMTGFDMAVLAAQGDEVEPRASGVMIADVVAASYAFGAVQSALLRRERFGEGAFVDVSLIESMMSLIGIQYQEAQSARPLKSRTFRPTRTADGYIVVPLVTARNHQSLFAAIGRPDWADDAVIASQAALTKRRVEIEDLLSAWAIGRTSMECTRVLNGAGAPCGAYAAVKDVLNHPHLKARGAFGDLEDADGVFSVLNPPFRFDNQPSSAGAFVPRLGEHTEAVVAALGAADPARPKPIAART